MAESSRSVLRLLREGHEDRVLGALRSRGSLSRAELRRLTGLSRTTLSSITGHLLATEAIVEMSGEIPPRRRGRPATLLALNPDGGLALGIDLGHQRVHAVIANMAHQVVASDSRACPENAADRRRIDVALALAEELTTRSHISLAALEGVGAGVVGPVPEAGDIPHTRRSGRVGLVSRKLAERFAVPVHVDNNTRLAALAEAIWGGGAGMQNVLYIRLSYGVGGGLVLGGHLFPGAFGGAGEFGHISVDPQGPPCPCGARGCLERHVSIDAILKQCRAADFDQVLERLRSGDAGVRETIREAGWRIGQVLAASCNVVNPEVVVIGGELVAAREELLGPIREALRDHAHRKVRQGLHVRAARLGDRGAALGGIALVLRKSTLLDRYPPTQRQHISAAGEHTSGMASTSDAAVEKRLPRLTQSHREQASGHG